MIERLAVMAILAGGSFAACSSAPPGSGSGDSEGTTQGGTTEGASATDDEAHGLDPVCGDGIVEGSEQCDDGNAMSCDGCSATCRIERNLRWARSVSAQDVTALEWLGDTLWWLTDEGRVLRLSADGEVAGEFELPGAESHAMVALGGITGEVAVVGQGKSEGERAMQWRIDPANGDIGTIELDLSRVHDIVVHELGTTVLGRDAVGHVQLETHDTAGRPLWSLPLVPVEDPDPSAPPEVAPFIAVRSDGSLSVLLEKSLDQAVEPIYTFFVVTPDGVIALRNEVGDHSSGSLDPVTYATLDAGADLMARFAYRGLYGKHIQLRTFGLDGELIHDASTTLGDDDYGLEEAGMILAGHALVDERDSLLLLAECRIFDDAEGLENTCTEELRTLDERWFLFGDGCGDAKALAVSPTGVAYVARSSAEGMPYRLLAIDGD